MLGQKSGANPFLLAPLAIMSYARTLNPLHETRLLPLQGDEVLADVSLGGDGLVTAKTRLKCQSSIH